VFLGLAVEKDGRFQTRHANKEKIFYRSREMCSRANQGQLVNMLKTPSVSRAAVRGARPGEAKGQGVLGGLRGLIDKPREDELRGAKVMV
jgi:hypothetical protein